jgi:hypothetical protein
MELEVVRAVSAGLQHATIGINAMIDALVIDTIGDLKPSHVTIYNYVDHPFVARKKINHDEVESGHVSLPAVAVYLEAPPTLEPEVGTIYRNGDFPVAISYVTIEPDEVKRMRDALYVNRALLRFLTQFNANADPGRTLRFRNNVNLYLATGLTQYTPFVPWEAALLAASTLVTYRCREHQP